MKEGSLNYSTTIHSRTVFLFLSYLKIGRKELEEGAGRMEEDFGQLLQKHTNRCNRVTRTTNDFTRKPTQITCWAHITSSQPAQLFLAFCQVWHLRWFCHYSTKIYTCYKKPKSPVKPVIPATVEWCGRGLTWLLTEMPPRLRLKCTLCFNFSQPFISSRLSQNAVNFLRSSRNMLIERKMSLETALRAAKINVRGKFLANLGQVEF